MGAMCHRSRHLPFGTSTWYRLMTLQAMHAGLVASERALCMQGRWPQTLSYASRAGGLRVQGWWPQSPGLVASACVLCLQHCRS